MTETVPTTDYERFLAALPGDLRDGCEKKLRGSGLAANHPVFLALAELYEKQNEKPARDFIQEATTHADLGQNCSMISKVCPKPSFFALNPSLSA